MYRSSMMHSSRLASASIEDTLYTALKKILHGIKSKIPFSLHVTLLIDIEWPLPCWVIYKISTWKSWGWDRAMWHLMHWPTAWRRMSNIIHLGFWQFLTVYTSFWQFLTVSDVVTSETGLWQKIANPGVDWSHASTEPVWINIWSSWLKPCFNRSRVREHLIKLTEALLQPIPCEWTFDQVDWSHASTEPVWVKIWSSWPKPCFNRSRVSEHLIKLTEAMLQPNPCEWTFDQVDRSHVLTEPVWVNIWSSWLKPCFNRSRVSEHLIKLTEAMFQPIPVSEHLIKLTEAMLQPIPCEWTFDQIDWSHASTEPVWVKIWSSWPKPCFNRTHVS